MISHSRPAIDESDIAAVVEVLRGGQIAQGELVERFESKMAAFLGKRAAVAVSSGTAALHVSLLASEIELGSAVAIPSYTCSSLLHAVEYVRGRPAVTDIHGDTFGMDVESLGEFESEGSGVPVAIVPHMFGRIVDLNDIRSRTGVRLVVEDVAMAIGHPEVGSGDIIACSFYATKMMTTGEGGMVLSDDKEMIERIIDIRDYDKKSSHRTRYNYKMTDIQAALGISQLARLPAFVRRREEISARYGKRQRACFRYVVRSRNLEGDIQEFLKRGIRCERPVYKPIHRHLGLKDEDYPETSRAMDEALSIPIYPALADDEVSHIAKAIEEIL